MAEKAFSLLQDALQDSEARAEELDAELRKQRQPRNKVEQQARVLEHRLESVSAECAKWKGEAAQLAEILENERAKVQGLRKKLSIAESGPDKVGKKEVNFWRSRAEQFDAEARDYKKRIAELRKSVKELSQAAPTVDAEEQDKLEAALRTAEQARENAEAQVKERDVQLAEINARVAALSAELTERETQIENLTAESADMKGELADLHAEREELKTRVAELDRLTGDLKARIEQLDAELARKRSEQTELVGQIRSQALILAENDRTLAERNQRIDELADTARQAEEQAQALRERLASLEDELKEEKECTVNLSEIANERREQVTELSEKLDEAQERYEEAKWHLERAGRFQRLVVKRRKLIDSLIDALRSRQKSNVALKAGLDGLRRYKAKAEQQEQNLLVRIEELSARLRDADERLVQQKESSQADEKLRKAAATISGLEERLDAQARVADELESELEAARAARQTAENRVRQLTELKSEAEQDKSLIDDLQLQVDSLKEELSRRPEAPEGDAPGATGASTADIRKRDAQIADLKRTVKDLEKEIARLRETAEGWQKKYEFLSTDSPSAYQSAAGET